jgi:hypothetical protein
VQSALGAATTTGEQPLEQSPDADAEMERETWWDDMDDMFQTKPAWAA